MIQGIRYVMVVILVQIATFVLYFLSEPLVLSNSHYGYLGINLFLLSLLFAVLASFLIAYLLRNKANLSIIFSLSICSGIIFLGYSNLYNIVIPVSLERSFSVSIFMNLVQKDGAWISKEQFFKITNADEIYKLRETEMLDSGLIEKSNDGYALTQKGLYIANIYNNANKYLRIRK